MLSHPLYVPLFFFLVSLLLVFFFSVVAGGARGTLLLRAFFYGVLAGPIAGVISHILVEVFIQGVPAFYWPDFWLFFLIIGPTEEAFKLLAFFLALKQERHISRRGYLLAAIAAALGFAGGENVLYVTSYGLAHTWPRLLLGNLGHAGYAALWGYAYALAVEGASLTLLGAAYLAACFLHGAYNYFLGFSYAGATISFSITLVLFYFLWNLLKASRSLS